MVSFLFYFLECSKTQNIKKCDNYIMQVKTILNGNSVMVIPMFTPGNYSQRSIIFGQRQSGKTGLLCNLINSNPNIDVHDEIHIFTSNIHDTLYATIKSPTTNIIGGMNIDKLEEILLKQKLHYAQNTHKNITIVFDDCITFANNITKHTCFADLLFHAPSYKISMYISMQFPFGLPPEIRSTIDNVFIMEKISPPVLSKIYKQYGQHHNDNLFNNIYENLKSDDSTMVLTNSAIKWYQHLTPSLKNTNESNYIIHDDDIQIIFDSEIEKGIVACNNIII